MLSDLSLPRMSIAGESSMGGGGKESPQTPKAAPKHNCDFLHHDLLSMIVCSRYLFLHGYNNSLMIT